MNVDLSHNRMIKRKRLHWWSPRMKLLYTTFPFIIFIFIFSYYPLFGWLYAFFDYIPGVPFIKQEFVGLYYFKVILTDPYSGFYNSLRNTLALNMLSILFSPLPIVFAVLLNELRIKRMSKFIQIVTSVPNFISWILVYAVCFSMFGNEGFINTLLINLRLIQSPIDVLGNANAAWFIQTGISIWKGLGWGAIIYIASMAGIDRELYDAADVDGAGRFQKIWHITVPGLMPTYLVLLLLGVSNMLNSGFEQYYVFRNPLVSSKLDVLDVFIYMKGIANSQFAFATAVGIMRSIVSVSLLMLVNALARRIRGSSIV